MLDDGMENSGQVDHEDIALVGGKGKVLLDKIVLDNAPKKKKKKNKNKDKSSDLSETIMEVESRAGDAVEVQGGESSSNVEMQKKKKKKGQLVSTESDSRDSEILLDTERTSEEVKQKESTANDIFCTPSSDSLQTKKKKKKKKSKKANEDDAPESVDSGCVVDGSVESLETTDWDQVSSALNVEHQFMSRLLAWIPVPTEIDPDDILAPTVTSEKKRKAVHFEDVEKEEGEGEKKWKKKKKAGEMAKESKFKKQLKEGHELVQNYGELKRRWMEKLESLKVNRKKVPKNAAERREEAKLKNRLKHLEHRRKQKLRKVQKKESQRAEGNKEGPAKAGPNSKKPVYTSDGQLVFSKFDFSTSSKDKEGKKKKQDLNKLLSQALKEKEKVKQLVEEGDIGKANELKEKKAWKGALMRAQGEKVRDDPELLKKSLKKKDGKKKQSQKKWEQRLTNEEKKKNELVQKKQSNVKARKKEKLQNKMKKMKKKGHIVPGF